MKSSRPPHDLVRALILVALTLGDGSLAGQTERPRTGKKWVEMDYGPFMTHSFEAARPEKNIAYKGVKVRLGKRGEAMVFDTDLLRWSAGWLQSDLDWKSVVYDGSHQTHPHVLGEQVFGNPQIPGWSLGRGFEDPRPIPYGPLPRGQARYRGLYRNGESILFSYAVGSTEILEMGGVEQKGEAAALARTIEIGKASGDLLLQVCGGTGGKAAPIPGEGRLAAIEGGALPTRVACVGAPGARFDLSDPAHIRLGVPAAATPCRIKILYGTGKVDELAALARSSAPPTDLKPLTKGGPAQWPEKVETKGARGAEDGPYAIDTIELPRGNPWRSWMRPGGFDFFSDPARAAVCTWSGDVWIVEGLGETLDKLSWRRAAAGLFQPLGLKIVRDQIFVTCRDQITRLHDLNGDGEADFYESFNHDSQVSEHFHEFAMGLQVDADGNFYYAKAARHALPPVVPQHGTLIKVSPDGARSEIVCNGFRAPNGVALGPEGELVTSDQEGHWVPANRINLLKKGGFYGNVWSYHEGKDPTAFDPPIVWLPPPVDRSPAEQLWVASDRWGPFKGKLISTSYGKGRIFLVPYEIVNGVPQGGAAAFPLRFPTGIMRGRFHPADGQLYVCGLVGWSTDCALEGGFYRVRFTGRPVRMPLGLHVTKDGIEIEFTVELDKVAAEDLDNYTIRQWNYRWTANYGSKNYKPSQPQTQGEDAVEVEKASLRGRRTVALSIKELRPVMQMEIAYSLKAADGAPVRDRIWLTINAP